MRKKTFGKVVSFVLALVLTFGILPSQVSAASSNPQKLAEAQQAEAQQTGDFKSTGEISSASTVSNKNLIAGAEGNVAGLVDAVAGIEAPEGLGSSAFSRVEALKSLESSTTEGALSANEQYVLEVAAMLTESDDVNVLDGYADSDVIEVMVWLRELPDVLERIYQSAALNVSGYVDAAAEAAIAREDIKAMGGSALKGRNVSSAVQIQFEYSEIFAGFAIAAPVSELKKIAAMPGVFTMTEMAYYELDYDDDPNYNTPGNLESREIARIGELHAEGIDGTGVTVGVIDSGIQTNHPEFEGAYVTGWSFNTNSSNMNVPDGDHGTHVSGTIASQGITSLGVAPGVTFYMAQVFHPTLSNSGADSVVTAAMEAFAGGSSGTGLPKVDVVNMSLGINSPDYNSAYISGVYARNNLVLAGVTLVNSAGNSATNRDSAARQNYTTTSSNASLSIAVASTLYGSSANWIYSSDLGGSDTFAMTVANGDSKLSGIFLSDDFGNNEIITVTYNASNTTGNPAWMDAEYYGTYTRQPLEYVEGLGYEIEYINNSVEDTTDAELAAWKAAHAANSMVGKILAFNRGISFNTMYGEAIRTGAGGVIMIDRESTSTVNMTIGNVPSAHGVVFQTGVAMRQVLLDAKNAGTIYFDPGSRASEDAAKEFSDFSSIGPVMENAHIKPDISAPGDNILSTSLNSGYTSMGGTSMSSPFVAGCAALLIQYARENGQDDSPAAIKARLMNTADPYLIEPNSTLSKGHPSYYFNAEGTESSVYEQGSGFINIWRAIQEDAYITVQNNDIYTGLNSTQRMTADMASFSFGEVNKGASRTLTATVHGLDDYDVAVSYNHDTRYSNKNEDLLVAVNVVKNGDTFDVTVTIDPNANADRLNGGNLYEGYITVTGNDYSYVLPWAVRIPHETVVPEEPQGTAPNAKITLVADSSLSMYTPTVGVSLWFDASNQLIDLFNTDEGVQFSWMNANCLSVPSGATMGGSVNNHLLIGQRASINLDPDTYDILAIGMQNTSTFIGAGEFRAVQEYPFEAGYEYVILVTGNSGGNPSFNLQARKTYNGDEPIEPVDGMATIILDVDEYWEDGYGVIMALDDTATAIERMDAGETVYVDLLSHYVPVGANADIFDSANQVLDGTASAQIPAGVYDYILMSPYYGDIYLAVENEDDNFGDNVEFKDGWTYTFAIRDFTLYITEKAPASDGPGTAPNAKVTFNHGSWGASYNLTSSIWFDASNYMYDNFKTETGISLQPAWMNANCVRLPETAQMVVRTSMYAGGQGGSMILTPDTYDILPVWSQTQQGADVVGAYASEDSSMVFEKEYPIEAGYEYIFTTSLTGGVPYLSLQIVPYNKEMNFDGNARITFDYDWDRWGDGSGYQMWFNGSGQLFDMLDGLGNLSGMTAADLAFIESICEYRIPEDARLLSAANGSSVKPYNSVTIDIAAGYYDYMSVNPDGNRNWLPNNANGLAHQKQYAFEAGMHYTFKVIANGDNDGLSLTIAEIGSITVLDEVNADIKIPAGGKVPQTTINVAGYAGTITWTPADEKFQWESDYSASVALTAKMGYEFGEAVNVTVSGALAVTNVVATAEIITFDVSFPNTGEQPPYATVIAVDESGGYIYPFSNLLAFDSTCTAVAKIEATGSINFVNDFDVWVPKIFAENFSSLFVGTDTNDEVPAGTYDFCWRVQEAYLGSGYVDYGTVTFEPYKTYMFVLDADWNVSVRVLEEGLDSLTSKTAEMNKLGGNWIVSAEGYFTTDFGYEVYFDGELFADGMFTGDEFTRTATVAIPENNTGVEQVYTLVVPYWEGNPNYAPQTLVVDYKDVELATIIFKVGDPWGDGSGYQLLLDQTATAYNTTVYTNYQYFVPAACETNHSATVWNSSESIVIPAGVYDFFFANRDGSSFFSAQQFNDFEFKADHVYIIDVVGHTATTYTITDISFTAENGTAVVNYAAFNSNGYLASAALPASYTLEYSINGGERLPLESEGTASAGKIEFDFDRFFKDAVDQEITIYATIAGAAMRASFSLDPYMVLAKSDVKISASALSNLKVGQKLTVKIATTPEGAFEDVNVQYNWTSSNSTIAAIENGVITALKPGTVMMTLVIKAPNLPGGQLTFAFSVKVSV